MPFQVEQADILPMEMVFIITGLPLLGHLVKLTNSTGSPVLDYIHSFTQEDINRGHVLYVSATFEVYCSFTYSDVAG